MQGPERFFPDTQIFLSETTGIVSMSGCFMLEFMQLCPDIIGK
jgi:hypothetical protein